MAEIIGEESHVLRPWSALHCTILQHAVGSMVPWTNVGGYVSIRIIHGIEIHALATKLCEYGATRIYSIACIYF